MKGLYVDSATAESDKINIRNKRISLHTLCAKLLSDTFKKFLNTPIEPKNAITRIIISALPI